MAGAHSVRVQGEGLGLDAAASFGVMENVGPGNENLEITADANGTELNGVKFTFGADSNSALAVSYNSATNTFTITADWDDSGSNVPTMQEVEDAINDALQNAGYSTGIELGEDGGNITNIAPGHLANAGTITMGGGTAPKYTVSILDDQGNALSKDVYTFPTAANAGADFVYNNHGVSFTLTQSDAHTLDIQKTLEYVDAVTYNYATDTTGAIAYNASTADVKTALEGLSTIGAGNVDVGGNSWTVTFKGDLGNQRVNLLQIDETGLKGKYDIGSIASADTKIRDIDRFWDASGNFLVADPQTITLVQGDGTKAAFTIFQDDTIQDVVTKIDAAIRNEKTNFTPGTVEAGKGLGQGEFDPNGDAQFAYYVTDPTDVPIAGDPQIFDAVKGTIVINSAINGKFGEIKFIGDEEVIKALSLTTIRNAVENRFDVTVINAHTGEEKPTQTITSNILVGVVHSNVDVEFDPNANVRVVWNDGEGTTPKGFTFEQDARGNGVYQTYVHMADSTMVYHIGANPQQDVAAAIGDMRTRALGVHNTLVMDRASANESISKIDRAIGRVSAERSKLGALQNRLEHTISNLAVASENLQSAESRIRDVDMAFEMMNFTKNQILAQAGTAMLAQANMKPQMVLQLLG